MPEIPDVSLYQHALNRFTVGRTIDALTVRSPFLVRTCEPEISAVVGHEVVGIRRMGKRIVYRQFLLPQMYTDAASWREQYGVALSYAMLDKLPQRPGRSFDREVYPHRPKSNQFKKRKPKPD